MASSCFAIRTGLLEKLPLYTESIWWEYGGLKVLSVCQLMDYFASHDFVKAIRDVYEQELELKQQVESGDWDKEVHGMGEHES